MRAFVRDRYGPPEVLKQAEVAKPPLSDRGVLVRVRATSVNAADWYLVAGTPFLARMSGGWRRPRSNLVGTDFAGVVEAVGKEVEGLAPGDEVYGGKTGAFAEYVCVENAVARKPGNLTFEEAAAVPVAGVTALQGLRDHARLEPGQKVLVNGASGGVGTFAVQVAKALGAEVAAVCSPRNVRQAGELGADRVIDYTREDFTRSGDRYDVLFDVGGGRSWREYTRVLTRRGTVVVAGVGGVKPGVLGPLPRIVGMRARSLGSSRRCVFFIAKLTRPELDALRELIEAGKVRPAIDRRYEWAELPDALAYLGEGHARGKVVVSTGAGEAAA